MANWTITNCARCHKDDTILDTSILWEKGVKERLNLCENCKDEFVVAIAKFMQTDSSAAIASSSLNEMIESITAEFSKRIRQAFEGGKQ